MEKNTNRLIGRAMHDYAMLADGDRIMIAVSGGIDSLVLSWVLKHWREKAPLDYKLLAVHLDMGFGGREHEEVQEQLERLEVPFLIEKTDFGKKALLAENGKSGCYHCARQRRNRLFEIARQQGFSKIAFGHHREDIIETFFLNLFYSGNMSTMVPRQELFEGRLTIIRPLAYLQKAELKKLGENIGLSAVANPCPMAEQTKRTEIRELINTLSQRNNRIPANIFSALANVKQEYLLAPHKRKTGAA